jgi:hypothetical protein
MIEKARQRLGNNRGLKFLYHTLATQSAEGIGDVSILLPMLDFPCPDLTRKLFMQPLRERLDVLKWQGHEHLDQMAGEHMCMAVCCAW